MIEKQLVQALEPMIDEIITLEKRMDATDATIATTKADLDGALKSLTAAVEEGRTEAATEFDALAAKTSALIEEAQEVQSQARRHARDAETTRDEIAAMQMASAKMADHRIRLYLKEQFS